MKRAPRSRQRHDLYAKYHDYDSEISDLLGECGVKGDAVGNCLTRGPSRKLITPSFGLFFEWIAVLESCFRFLV